MEDTVSRKSIVGERLSKIQKTELRKLVFEDRNIPVVSKITVGRVKSNDIVIESQLVSRHHAEIHKIKDDYFVKDLKSKNGTYVNKTLIPADKYYRLSRGDIIIIGKAGLKFD